MEVDTPIVIAYSPPSPKKHSRAPRVILGMLIVATTGILIGVWALTRTNSSDTTTRNTPATTALTVPFEPSTDSSYRSTWLVYWDDGSGLDSFKTHAKQFKEFHPFWYETQSATSIEAQGTASFRAEALQAAKSAGVRIVPTLTESLKTDDFLTFMSDPRLRTQHVDTVCQLARDNNFDGLDIDYELFALGVADHNVEPAKNAFTAFITDLAICLHANSKTLEVTMLPKTDDSVYAPYLNSLTPGVFDYYAIGKAADIVRPMAYDNATPLTNPRSTDPINWAKAVGEYTRTYVPAKKVVLGIALYGYDWNTTKNNAKAITARQAIALAKVQNASLQYNDETKSRYFEYQENNGESHEVWFDTSADTKLRANLAKELGLAGVSYWSAGNEDRDFLNYLGIK